MFYHSHMQKKSTIVSHEEIARKGGLATKAKYGKEHYQNRAFHMNAVIKQRKEQAQATPRPLE